MPYPYICRGVQSGGFAVNFFQNERSVSREKRMRGLVSVLALVAGAGVSFSAENSDGVFASSSPDGTSDDYADFYTEYFARR